MVKLSIPQDVLLNYNSLFTSYWFYGDLQLLSTQFDRKNAYIFNNFLNLYSFGYDDFSLYFAYELKHKQMEMYTHCPFLEYRIIERIKQPMTISFIKTLIDYDWSVIVYVNRKEFKNYSGSDCPHQIMVYGYDDRNRTLRFCDNGPTGRYRHDLECDYDAFIHGYHVIDDNAKIDTTFDFENHCYAFKPKPCHTYDIDLYKISQEFNTYIGKIPNEYAYIGNIDGINIYDHMESYLTAVMNNETELNPHMGSYSVLIDHKSVCESLCDELAKQGIVDGELKNEYNAIKKSASAILYRLLCYLRVPSHERIQNVIDTIKQMRETEFLLISKILDQIG